MKRNLSAIVVGIALAYAAFPAAAVDTSTVNQTGAFDTANVQQIASPANFNTSSVNQDGNYHTAAVYQANNTSWAGSAITQNGGTWNNASVVQDGNTGVNATILHAWGGNNNTAAVTQTGVAGGQAVIFQSADNNVGTINQHNGAGLTAMINANDADPVPPAVFYGVNGFNNTAGIDQTGSDQLARIRQHDGSFNTAGINQVGAKGDAFIDQSGSYNVAQTYQNGYGTDVNKASTIQAGLSNQAYTTQTGNNYVSSISQTGNNHFANVWQH
jgi:hypothetical protein